MKNAIIIGLLIIIYLLTLQDAPIKKINETINGDYIRINATITNYQMHERITTFTLKDETGSINAIIFDRKELINNQNKEVTGRIGTYKGKKELITVKIK